MKIMVLAGGYGTRLYSIIKDTSKALLKINNKALVDHILERFYPVPGITEVVVVTNNKFYAQFESWRTESTAPFTIRIVNDQTNTPETRLGSVGDMHYVWKHEHTADDWMVVGGDNLFDFKIDPFIAYAQGKRPHVAMGVYDIGKVSGAAKFGVVQLNEEGRLVGFVEKPKHPQSSLVAMCFYYFPKESLPLVNTYIEEGGSPDAVGGLIQWLYEKNNVYGFQFQGKWYDIGSFESLKEAQQVFSS
jgi:glucose-1-phosphate thymidylyltransferase